MTCCDKLYCPWLAVKRVEFFVDETTRFLDNTQTVQNQSNKYLLHNIMRKEEN